LYRGGLGRRILLWFLVLSLVPLLVSNTIGYGVTRRIIEGQIRRYLRAVTEIQAAHVAAEVERHQLYLDGVVAGNMSLARGVSTAARAVGQGRRQDPAVTSLQENLEHTLSDLASFSELFVLDTAGIVVAATRQTRLGGDWSDSELFRSGRAGRFFTEAWEERDGRLEPLCRLAVPIRHEGSGFSGVLAASVDQDELQAFLHIAPHVAGDVHAYITDRRGRPLFVSHVHAPIDHGQPLPSPLIGREPGSNARYSNYEEIEVLGTSVQIPDLDWLYISEVSVASAFGQLRSLALLAAALESVFALLLVGIVWLVAWSIVSPLRRLVGAAERIREGELGVEVGIDRDDELGELSRTFDQMSRELEASTHQIHELHEQELRRAAQLASVGELSSGIVHEIKNPLVGVASGLDLLSDRLDEADLRSQRILGQIRDEIHRMEVALQDLLSYARPKEPRLVRATPEQLIERLITLVRPQAEAGGTSVRYSCESDLPPVEVDPDLLNQALINLALNGIQAMEPGGVLDISASRAGDTVRFSVSDTGTGIPQERLQDILKPFFTTKHQGTGLGLAITRGIVERHGGRLEVESEPGAGSTFTIVISVAAQKAAVP
jgi:signal transduction histidine kinase